MPKSCPTGRPREWPMREIVNGVFYVMRAGRPWRLLPNDLPPWGTIYRWFAAWRDDGRFERINHALVMAVANGSDATPAPRLRSSTARASRPPRLADHAATMLERRSTDASAIRSSTQPGVASRSNRIRRASKIAMVTDRLCESRGASSRSSSGSSPTAGMPARRSPRPR